MRTIVVSGVNLRKGGTLTIMRQCLEYLTARTDEYRIVALVHRKDLYATDGIEYMELPWCTRSWLHRLWAEYVTMHRISRQIAAQDGRKVWLWLSMHDTTPRVEAEHQEVYCHTSFPFLKVRLRDWFMDPKVPLFAAFTRLAYKINVNRNDCLIVQQNWFAEAMSGMLNVPRSKFRVIPPVFSVAAARLPLTVGTIDASGGGHLEVEAPQEGHWPLRTAPTEESSTSETSGAAAQQEGHWPLRTAPTEESSTSEAFTRNAEKIVATPTFLFPSTPDCHKNFETLCEAARILEREGCSFLVIITVRGDENRYARWLKRKWGDVASIDFHGLMKKDELYEAYGKADCLVFPSRIETWGLPISEFVGVQPEGKLILSDLPYAHETSATSKGRILYFNPDSAEDLAEKMKEVMR